MLNRTSDVIVLGLGCAGSAALHSCAARGLRAVGLEQFDIAHDRGSSHGESRIFRIAYYEHPDYVPLLKRAHAGWNELEEKSGKTLLHRGGGIWFGRPGSPLIADTAAAARAHGLPHELIEDRGAIGRRFPGFCVPLDYIGFFEQDAGVLLPEESIRTFIDLAKRDGADVRTHERALSWTVEDFGSIVVETDRDLYRTARLIVTAGPWTAALVPDLKESLTVTRQPVCWFEVHDPERFSPDRFSCWAVEKNPSAFYYGFPLVAGGNAMKVSVHEVRETTDPDTVNREVSLSEIDELKSAADRIFPGMISECARTAVCMYTNSPDGHFMIGPHPANDNVIIATGFSGHGFKFAPVLGEALADLAIDRKTTLPISFLSPGRLQNRRAEESNTKGNTS